MKVVFNTNIYISWIRERRFAELLLDVKTQKYMPSFVLMELWAGAKTKQAGRIVERLQKPYIKADRIIEPDKEHFITVGQFLSNLPESQNSRKRSAGFINDVFIALSALSIGAKLFTTNISDFKLIASRLPELKILFL